MKRSSLATIFWLALAAHPAAMAQTGQEAEDPLNLVFQAEIKEGRVLKYKIDRLSGDAFSTVRFPKDKPKPPADVVPEKIHPVLNRWLAERKPDEYEILVVNFRDELKIPRFPEPETLEGRDYPANRASLSRATELVREIASKRADSYKRLAEELRGQYKAVVLQTFWLINAVTVKAPLGAVRELAARPDVLYVEPDQAGDVPPQNEVSVGRSRIVSDPYFNLGLTGGWIGLLDTGMRFTHTQFNAPDHIAFQYDCVNGGADCNTAGPSFNPNDDCWNHGTSTAGIITANSNQGNLYRGVTGITLDSLKVYPTSFDAFGACNGFLSTTASVRGFERAVEVLDRVIVAEMQGSGNYLSAISVAADNAFDSGAVVIAANGNNGPAAGSVNAPANAHRVLGVGNFDVQTLVQINSQSRGPTPDNRYKPDIQAPTNTRTASNANDTALRTFTGTSGATPYASGAAALLRNWLRGTSFSIDPGQVYAQMILSGQQPYPFNNTSGAGPLNLPTNGYAWWGKVSISNGQTIDISLPIGSANANTLDGALWWPEYAFNFGAFTLEWHNDVDLHLVDPSGVTRDWSLSIPSVYERARVAGSVSTGTWKLRIRGYNVSIGPQTVYWAAHVRNF
jgi:hypothetical protein